MLALPRDTWSGHFFARSGLAVVDNSPEDILAAVDQILARSGDHSGTNEGHCARQSKFREIAAARKVQVNGSIAEQFLERYAALLEVKQ
jgi:hypothetical protein